MGSGGDSAFEVANGSAVREEEVFGVGAVFDGCEDGDGDSSGFHFVAEEVAGFDLSATACEHLVFAGDEDVSVDVGDLSVFVLGADGESVSPCVVFGEDAEVEFVAGDGGDVGVGVVDFVVFGGEFVAGGSEVEGVGGGFVVGFCVVGEGGE